MELINKALELLFPSNIYCLSCGSLIDRSRPYALCDHCIQNFHWVGSRTCEKCGKLLAKSGQLPQNSSEQIPAAGSKQTPAGSSRRILCTDCQSFSHSFDKGYTCAQYGLYERALMMDYKYRKKSYIGRKLGDILFDRICPEDPEIDLILPVPVHKSKYKSRGYNQAAILAHHLADKMKLPCADVLIRTKNTNPMRGLNPVDRQENLRDAFAISPQNHYALCEKQVLLIDDIYTTGSTLDACSQVLKQAGVKKVFVLTFAAGADRRKQN